MKNFGNIIKLLTLAFVCIFLLNMLIMHVFFNTDVFYPLGRTEANITEIRFSPEDTANENESQEEANPESTSGVTDDYFHEDIEEAAPVEGNGVQAASEALETDSTYYMTTGEVGFLENLSFQDKMNALYLISKVGREYADKIYDLAIGGITYAEMSEIKAILNKFLDHDEMNKLTALLEKNKKQYSAERD